MAAGDLVLLITFVENLSHAIRDARHGLTVLGVRAGWCSSRALLAQPDEEVYAHG